VATRWAVQNGNWSDTATWNGGTLPAVDDDVHADGRTVTIDQDVTVLSLRTTARSGGTVGGTYALVGGTTITATFFLQNNITSFTFSGSGSVTINGNLSGGNISGGTVAFSGSGTLTINGDLIGGSGDFSRNIWISGNGTLIVNGNVYGGNNNGRSAAAIFLQSGSPTVLITGTIESTLTKAGIPSLALQAVGGSPQITVVGEIRGTDYVAVSIGSAVALFTFTGSIYGGVNNGLVVETSNGLATLDLTGPIISSSVASAVSCNTTPASLVCTGPFISGPSGINAVYSRRLKIRPTAGVYYEFRDDSSANGEPLTLYPANAVGGNPPVTDVRQGAVYGPDDELTGTLAVPPPDSVAAGVPTDNTVGTAAVKLSDIGAVMGAQIAAAITNAGEEE
jgi:hypothetical protein